MIHGIPQKKGKQIAAFTLSKFDILKAPLCGINVLDWCEGVVRDYLILLQCFQNEKKMLVSIFKNLISITTLNAVPELSLPRYAKYGDLYFS